MDIHNNSDLFDSAQAWIRPKFYFVYNYISTVKMKKGYYKIFRLCIAHLLLSNFCTAQNKTLVINGTYCKISGGTQAKNISIVINQSGTLGIISLGGGYIISEGQYNYVQWNAGTNTGNYTFPFGVAAVPINYIPFTFNKTTGGSSNLKVSTWGTNPQNIPHPSLSNVAAVTSMNCSTMNATGDSVTAVIDRFWDIQTSAAATGNLTFSYLGSENTTANPTGTFDAEHWNGAGWDLPVGSGNVGVTAGVGTVGPVIGQSTFSPWTLVVPPITFTATGSATICKGNSTILTAAGGNTYTWMPGGLITSSITVNPSTTTVYSVTGTNANGCRVSIPATGTVTVNALPTLTIVPTATNICLGNTSTLTASGANTYTWSPAGSLSSLTGTPVVATPTTTTSYTVNATDNNGCTNNSSIIISVAATPSLTINSSSPFTICLGDSVIMNVSGANTYTWAPATNLNSISSATVIVTPTTTTVYSVTGTIAGCESSSASATVTVNTSPQPVISGNNHFCKGTSTVLNVTPTGANFIYQWNQGGIPIGGATNSIYTATGGGTFGVAVTNTLTGCKHDTLITITVDSVPATPIITTNTTNNTYCQGQTINPISVNETGTFTWYSDAGLTTQIGTGSPFIPSVTTTSTIYVTASSSVCTSDSTPVVITINPTPATPTITVGAGNNVYCQNQTVGTITASGPSTIVWYSNAGLTTVVDTGTTYTPTGLPFGTTTYYLIDSSVAGCKSVGITTVSVTINATPNTPVVISPTTNTYCQNQTVGAITSSGSSTIVWYDNAGLTHVVDTGTTYTPIGLLIGTTIYYLVDSSAAGCKSTGTATVSVTMNATPTTPTVTTGSSVIVCQGSTMPTINATGNGTLVWYNNAALTPPFINTGNSYTPSNIPAGTTATYYITDTSAAGCQSSAATPVSVTAYPKPVITGNATIDSAKCGKNNGDVLGLSVQNGTPQYTYQWINSSGTVVGDSLNLTNVGGGTYSLVVIDANLCRDTSNGSGFVVGSSSVVTANFTPSITEGQAPLAVTFSNTSVGAPVYEWNFGTNTSTSTQTNPAHIYTASGTYTVTLIASNGNCSDTARKGITIDVTEVLIIPNIFSPNGDGINDQYFITCVGINSLYCDIFNRWGELIFTLNAPNQSWDGVMNNGNHATEGTYFYLLQANGYDGKDYKRNGTLTLVR